MVQLPHSKPLKPTLMLRPAPLEDVLMLSNVTTVLQLAGAGATAVRTLRSRYATHPSSILRNQVAVNHWVSPLLLTGFES